MNTSNPNVTNFVTDLVAMAKATEELPIIRAALSNETEHANRLAKTVQDRELSIMDLKAKLEEAQAKIRQTEAERDDAELRFLEADDKAHKVLALVRGVQNALGETVVTLDPPKPEPEPKPDPNPPAEPVFGSNWPGTGQSGVDPITAPTQPSSDSPVVSHTSAETAGGTSAEHVTPVPPVPAYTANPTSGAEDGSTGHSEVPKDTTYPVGQSDRFPTSQPLSDSTPYGQADSTPSHPSQPEDAHEQFEEVKRPYSGMKYINTPEYISRHDWIAGGGAEADYDWRP